MINFFIRSRICLLHEDDRRRICAEVVKSCLRNELKQVSVDEIEDEIEYVGVCTRRDFFVELPEGGYHRSRKRMFRCGSFTISGERINGFYVSAAGKPGAALIFTRVGKSVKNSYLTVSYLVRGLMYHLWPFMYRPKYLLPDNNNPAPTEENWPSHSLIQKTPKKIEFFSQKCSHFTHFLIHLIHNLKWSTFTRIFNPTK